MPVYDFTSADGITGHWRIPGENASTPNITPPNSNWGALSAPTNWNNTSAYAQYSLVNRNNAVYMALNAIPQGGTSGTTYTEVARYNDSATNGKRVSGGAAYHSIPEVCVNHTAASGTFPSTTTGTWRLRYEPSGSATQAAASITGNLTVLFAGNTANPYRCIRVGNSGDYVSTFGVGSSNATNNSPARFFGGTWHLDRVTTGTGPNTAPESDSTNWMLVTPAAWSPTSAYPQNSVVTITTPTQFTEQARWNAGNSSNTQRARYFGGQIDAIYANTTALSGSFPAATAGNWFLQKLTGTNIGQTAGALTTVPSDAGTTGFRVGTQAHMQQVFGDSNHPTSETGVWVLLRQSTASTTTYYRAINTISAPSGGSAENDRRLVQRVVGSTPEVTTFPAANTRLATWNLQTGFAPSVGGITVGVTNNHNDFYVARDPATAGVISFLVGTDPDLDIGDPLTFVFRRPGALSDVATWGTIGLQQTLQNGIGGNLYLAINMNLSSPLTAPATTGGSFPPATPSGTRVEIYPALPTITPANPGTINRAWRRRTELLTGDRVLAYDSDATGITAVRDTTSDFDLIGATWTGGTATSNKMYFVQSTGSPPNETSFARAYNLNGTRDTTSDISLGAGNFNGAFTTSNRIYFVNPGGNVARAYDHNRVRQASDDINLGAGGWTGGFATPTKMFFIESGQDWARAWNFNGTRDTASDFDLTDGPRFGGFYSPLDNRIYIATGNAGSLLAFSSTGTRQATNDVSVPNNTVGAFYLPGKFVLVRSLIFNGQAAFYSVTAAKMLWRTV